MDIFHADLNHLYECIEHVNNFYRQIRNYDLIRQELVFQSPDGLLEEDTVFAPGEGSHNQIKLVSEVEIINLVF